MSRLKDRLLNYHIQVKKFADDDQMILQWKIEYLQSQRAWLFALLGGKMEDSYVQQMSEMWKETDGSGKH